jgi:hypothetical protein
MKVKSQRDFVAGLLFIVIGIAFAWRSLSYSFGDAARPGPGYFPFGLGVILALLGALVTFKSLTIESSNGDPIGAVAWRPLVATLGAVALFGFALPRLGLVLAVPLLILVASLAGDRIRWPEVLLLGAVLTLMSCLVFVLGLNLAIPLWPGVHGS